MVTASISASPGARNAAPTPPSPTASRGNFGQASAYRRVDPDEITGSVPKAGDNCNHVGCNEYVAITCQR
jgi:hypothetical protein